MIEDTSHHMIRCLRSQYYTLLVSLNKRMKEDHRMDKYVCNVCGYVYDPEDGDPDNGVAPGTAFDDVPDDWTCPVCGAGKSDFEKEE